MITFEIERDGQEPFAVKVTTRDVRKWEKVHKASATELLNSGELEVLYELAYYAASRTGNFKGTLEEFEDSCDMEWDVEEAPLATPQEA